MRLLRVVAAVRAHWPAGSRLQRKARGRRLPAMAVGEARDRTAVALEAVEAWLFDLDNTLYPASCDLFAQIDRRMQRFIEETLDLDPATARQTQKRFFQQHGTTLRGLMDHHGIDPDIYLDYVHDIELDALSPNPALDAAIAALPGRKLIFTNA